MTTAQHTAPLDKDRNATFMMASLWEDGSLSDLEIAAVCLAIVSDPRHDMTCKEALRHWLEQNQPIS